MLWVTQRNWRWRSGNWGWKEYERVTAQVRHPTFLAGALPVGYMSNQTQTRKVQATKASRSMLTTS
jgi:hypothetical protein